jgi:hypothetical protein
MKRYFVTPSAAIESVRYCNVEQIAFYLNAGRITPDHLAAEMPPPEGLRFYNLKSPTLVWVPVLQILKEAYDDMPLTTVVVKDKANNNLLLSERFHSEWSSLEVAHGAVENYFQKCFKVYSQSSPKEFLVYFKSDQSPESVFVARLHVRDGAASPIHVGLIEGLDEDSPPYTYETAEPSKVLPPNEFPVADLDSKTPKYGTRTMFYV